MAANTTIFQSKKHLIGMVHVRALPGTPAAAQSIDEIITIAVREAKQLADAGFTALIVENMHDTPYLRRNVGPEIVAAMTAVVCAVTQAVSIPVGVQILAGANKASLGVALASGGAFIRAEGFTFAAVADEGLLDEADAGPLLRYRKAIGAEHIAIITDIKKKHSSHALTADIDLQAHAHAAKFCGADGVIITGASTGMETNIDDVAQVRTGTSLPVIIGSGVRADTVGAFKEVADAVIIGSALKVDGRWRNELDADRVNEIARQWNA